TTTTTTTSSPTTTTTTTTTTTSEDSFNGPGKRKRQVSAITYVGTGDQTNPTNCNLAAVFRIGAGGTLTIGGTPLLINPEAPFVALRANSAGSVAATFTTNNGQFAWFNSAFFNGQAGFCQDSSGQVYATFRYPSVAANVPAGCTPVALNVTPRSSCSADGIATPLPTSVVPGTSATTTPGSTPSTPIVNPGSTPTSGGQSIVPTPGPSSGASGGPTSGASGNVPTSTGSGTNPGGSNTQPGGSNTQPGGSTNPSASNAVSNPPSVGSFAFLGCFTSISFPTFEFVSSDPSMTVEKCTAACPAGKRLAAMLGTECYCGDAIDNSLTILVAQSECNLACPGNPAQSCGGRAPANRLARRQAGGPPVGVRLTVYVRVGTLPPVVSTVVSVSVSTGPGVTVSVPVTAVVTITPAPNPVPTNGGSGGGGVGGGPNVAGTLTLPPGLYTVGAATPGDQVCRVVNRSWFIGQTSLLPALPTAAF
ncbi:hypothetical protein CTA2_935, partial [Colletotrichum tanaceti]